MKNKIKKNIPELLSFVIPILIMLIACLISKTYPLGEQALSKYDGYYQYIGFTNYYKTVLLGKNSLFYSFKGLLGFNFYATAIYYLFNPTNLLCIFSTNNTILEYYTLIIFLRIGLSGFTMCKYIKYKYPKQSNITYIIFSITYALMAYNVTYYFNYMFFDTIVLFPITMLGLQKLIDKNDNRLYIISLTLSILSNYYIGYMVCIFSLLYFIYQSYIYKKDKKTIKNFIISSLLSGFICSIILIPEALELLEGKALLYKSADQTDYFKFNLNFLNIFYKAFPGTINNYDLKYGMVNIYISMLVIVLDIKYFFNKKITKKEKKATAIFILFFLLSISFNLIDYAWQLFQRPIWYPNRYIFTFSFLLIVIAMKELINIENKTNIKRNILLILIYILLTIYPMLTSNANNNIVKIIAYTLGILLLIQYTFFLNNKNAKYLIILLFFIEIIFNTIITIKSMPFSTTIEYYKLNNDLNEKAVNEIKKLENKDSFYRMEINSNDINNTGLIYNYNGINHFNSIRNGRIITFFKRFNYKTNSDASVTFDNYNPYITSLLGIKYINGSNNEFYYKNIYNTNPYIYLNNDYLSLGYMINYNDIKFTNSSYKNTELLVNSMLNKNENIYEIEKIKLHKINIINQNNTKYIKPESDTESYIEISNKAKQDIFLIPNKNITYEFDYKVYINNKVIENASSKKFPLFIKKDDNYKIIMKTSITKLEYNNTNWYKIDYDKYINFINELKKNQLKITKYNKDNNIEGNIIVNERKTLLLTIPYNKGWNIKVDNKKVEYKSCYDTFICLDLQEGKHNIKLNYIPRGFIIGSIISLVTLIISIIYIRKK